VTAHPFGRSGLAITRLGLGLAALGRPAYITSARDRDLGADRSVAAMEQRCHEMLDAAYAHGIRYVDAARSYGMAETFLSSWLHSRELSSSAMTIGSKWGYRYAGDWRLDAPAHEVKDLSLGALQRQIRESRALLGNHLDLYQIHSATLESGVLEDAAVLRELVRLGADGLRIGLTVSGPRQADVIRRALEVRVDGRNPFSAVQATWNLLETSAAGALKDAHRAGWGVIVKEALANGRLTGEAGAASTVTGAAGADAGAALPPAIRELTARLSASIDRIALAAAVAQPWVDIVLTGAVTRAQLDANVEALDLAAEPAVAELAADAPAEPPQVYWTRRSARAWT
jgi:aryl-alcohol dehydrogenase-like predicted oxidoreductase